MLLFVVLSWQIEEKYGAFRVAFIFFWSAIGGEPELGLLQLLTMTIMLFPQAALLFFVTSCCWLILVPPLLLAGLDCFQISIKPLGNASVVESPAHF